MNPNDKSGGTDARDAPATMPKGEKPSTENAEPDPLDSKGPDDDVLKGTISRVEVNESGTVRIEFVPEADAAGMMALLGRTERMFPDLVRRTAFLRILRGESWNDIKERRQP